LNTIAFQFSFGVTAFILLGYSPINRGIEHWFPKRRLEHILEMDGWNQHGYIMLTLFKQAFALSVAINLISFPLTLYFFEKFPIMGLIYNLFFPFLVSISLFLLFLGTLFSLFPYVGNFFHYFNDFYTNLILKLTYQMPDFIDYYIEIESLNFYVILCYLSFISLLLIVAHQHCKENSHSSSDSKWIFI
jgi:competence protein ComEC